jgi:hypothetical protein
MADDKTAASPVVASHPRGEPADDLAKGVVGTAKQSFRDLFIWKQRVVVSNAYGETRCEWRQPDPIQNPISLFAQLSGKDWLFFIVGFLAWTADAFDFHALSIQQSPIAAWYGRSKTEISTAITLTLLLRSVGAAFFGFAGDKWGRKWPMVLNMIVLGLLQIATIYSTTFQQFLAVRSLFGLFMGGVYGNAIAMALEQCPTNARGMMSGILQQGYSFGYVLAACAYLGIKEAPDAWKTVFWIGGEHAQGYEIRAPRANTTRSWSVHRHRLDSCAVPRVPAVPRRTQGRQESLQPWRFLARHEEDVGC